MTESLNSGHWHDCNTRRIDSSLLDHIRSYCLLSVKVKNDTIGVVLYKLIDKTKGKERLTKTDRIDAQLIARELKDGRLTSIRVPDKCREQLRSLFRRRNDLVKDMRQIKSYIKMQLLYYGMEIPPEHDNDHWSHDFRHWLDDLKFEYDM